MKYRILVDTHQCQFQFLGSNCEGEYFVNSDLTLLKKVEEIFFNCLNVKFVKFFRHLSQPTKLIPRKNRLLLKCSVSGKLIMGILIIVFTSIYIPSVVLLVRGLGMRWN